jgi:hypothetical protein
MPDEYRRIEAIRGGRRERAKTARKGTDAAIAVVAADEGEPVVDETNATAANPSGPEETNQSPAQDVPKPTTGGPPQGAAADTERAAPEGAPEIAEAARPEDAPEDGQRDNNDPPKNIGEAPAGEPEETKAQNQPNASNQDGSPKDSGLVRPKFGRRLRRYLDFLLGDSPYRYSAERPA